MNYTGLIIGLFVVGTPIAIIIYKIIRKHKENVILNEQYKEIKQKKKDSK